MMTLLVHLLEHLGVPSGAAIAIAIASNKALKSAVTKRGGAATVAKGLSVTTAQGMASNPDLDPHSKLAASRMGQWDGHAGQAAHRRSRTTPRRDGHRVGDGPGWVRSQARPTRREKLVNTVTVARWSDWRRWMGVARACVLGLVLASVWLSRPVPGLRGQHLVLLVGCVLAVLVCLAWLPVERVDKRIRVPILVAGMVGGCLASLVSPNSVATALPAAIGLLAGTSLSVLEAAGVAACGLITLWAGSLVVTASGSSLLGASLAVVGGLLAGLWRGQYRLRAEQAELAAIQTRRAEREHVRAQVLDERARIAREIHDILAHTLGGLVVQLDAADALLGEGDDSEGGRRLVGGARRLAVAGLEETRQAIAALRTDPADLPEALAVLTAGDGRHGQVSYQLRGTPRRLAPEASLAVYRTAQEALTNARKYAPGAAVAMTLSFGEQAAVLQVANDTPPGAPAGHPTGPLAATGGGYGLNGLTERAQLLGGTLHAGPGENGWVVELTVPG
jgi:signal transduction histidine kinase